MPPPIVVSREMPEAVAKEFEETLAAASSGRGTKVFRQPVKGSSNVVLEVRFWDEAHYRFFPPSLAGGKLSRFKTYFPEAAAAATVRAVA